jgi:hypothetical protein
MKISGCQFVKNGIVFTECLLYSPMNYFLPPKYLRKRSQLLKQYSGTSLKRPGYVFRDGLDNSYRSFIISDDDRKWWSILWTGDRVQADNLLDVAIDVWQSRLRNVLDES